MDTWDIILIVLGCVFVVLTLIAACIFVFIVRQRRRKLKRSVSPIFEPKVTPHHLVYGGKRDSSIQSNGHTSVGLSPRLETDHLQQSCPISEEVVVVRENGSKKLHRPDRIIIPSISQGAADLQASLITKIDPHNFANHVVRLKRNDNQLMNEEFEILNRQGYSLMKDTTASQRAPKRNRFPDVMAYDHTRIRLLHRSEDDDYINASYIMNYDDSFVQFIAAQGPIGSPEPIGPYKEDTVEDFWMMLWQENVQCIVMLTQIVEHLKLKCADYWPHILGESVQYGSLTVTLVAETEYATALQRTFDVTDGREIRSLTHFHFEQWLDCKGPESKSNLLQLVLRVKEMHYNFPVLVHCSAGIGRTGVFIALWQTTDAIDADPLRPIDIFDRVLHLRDQRVRMVQSQEQYKSLYEATQLYLQRKGLSDRRSSAVSISEMSEDSRYDIQEISAV